VAVLACAFGMACKESMVTAPILVALFDRAFLFPSFRDAWSARRGLYLALATTWLILAGLLATNPRPHSAGFSSGVSAWQYLLNQPPVLLRYLEQAVWPNALVLLYGWPRSITLAEIWPEALAIVGLLVLTVVLAWRRPQLGFLGMWFWITLAPTSSFVPIATEVAAERRMYLPLMALIALGVVGSLRVWERLVSVIPNRTLAARIAPVTAVLVLTMVSAGFAAATAGRNREYTTPVTMARTVVERHPTPIAYLSLGRALLDGGDRQEGLRVLRQALPGAPGAHFTLGLELLTDGQLDEGVAELRAFVQDQPPFLADVVVARAAMGEVFLHQERWPEAAQEFRLILDVLPGHAVAEHHLADALFSLGEWNEAAARYRAYLAKEPQDAGALNNLGVALGRLGQLDGARTAFRRAVDADPSHGPALHNLAQVLLGDFEFDQALMHARRAVEIQPDDAYSYELLGRILLKLGRLAEAERQFARVLELNPASTFAREELHLLRRVYSPGRGVP
jgi:tetratricopeptide (TPR) repeat protein